MVEGVIMKACWGSENDSADVEEKSHSGTGGGHRGSDVWAVVQQDLLPEKVFSYNRQEEGAKLDFF